MEEHAKRTGINSIDTFFANNCCSRSCRKSLMKSDHPDDTANLKEIMRIFGITKNDIEKSDQELKLEHVASYQSN